LQQTPTEEEFVPDFDEVPAKKPDDNWS
jgi:hypothetical protein